MTIANNMQRPPNMYKLYEYTTLTNILKWAQRIKKILVSQNRLTLRLKMSP